MSIPKGGIAFFDSGIGGLTVLEDCRKILPNEIFYYYGDNHHAPYGNRTEGEIRRFVLRAFRCFARLRAEAVVIACNTATAICVEELRKKYVFPILGIEPAILPALKNGGLVYVLTTKATSQSRRFQELCEVAQKRFQTATLVVKPCLDLAGEIESHLGEEGNDFTPFLPTGNPDSVVLGCTHYIYIEEEIRKYYQAETYHGNGGVARVLFQLFERKKREDWDGRPPVTPHPSFLGFLTTFYPKNLLKNRKGKNANFCSFQIRRNALKNQTKPKIYFLGKNKKKNEKIYKQTYVRD